MEIPAGRTGTWLTNADRTLGQGRLDAHVRLSGTLTAMHQALTISVFTAPLMSWNDEALAAMCADAADLERAAKDYADFARMLAKDWHAQRTEQEVE